MAPWLSTLCLVLLLVSVSAGFVWRRQTRLSGLIAGIFFGFIPIVAGITNLLTLESVSKVWKMICKAFNKSIFYWNIMIAVGVVGEPSFEEKRIFVFSVFCDSAIFSRCFCQLPEIDFLNSFFQNNPSLAALWDGLVSWTKPTEPMSQGWLESSKRNIIEQIGGYFITM